MANKLIQTSLGQLPPDDRDSYINKRIELCGTLINNLFRNYFNKLVKEMQKQIVREINSGSWRSTEDYENIVNMTNIYKIMKSTTIENGLNRALATGDFSIKQSNSSKVGVAQVLNRLTYVSSLSHLRRINTPLEKSGELIAPRKLHNITWGFLSPAETPEGQSIGVVKNISYMGHITIPTNSSSLYDYVTPHIISVNDTSPEKLYGKVKVFVNGAWLGIATDPVALYNDLKEKKYKGIINIYTSIIFNYKSLEIRVCNDGGRLTRPVLRIKNNKAIIDNSVIARLNAGEIGWNDLLTNCVLGESVIEYIDPEEQNFAMIAMKCKDQYLQDPNLRFNYTHCEIHPSTIFGVLASCIPYPEHNQAPRNTYQCLEWTVPVLMSDGSYKPIRDVKKGDMVKSFHQTTFEIIDTEVVNHFFCLNEEPMYKIVTGKGTEILATDDHKFMTTGGWQMVKEIRRARFGPDAKQPLIKIGMYSKKTGECSFVNIETIMPAPNCFVADIEVASENHSFIAGHAGFMSSNCAMGKQAMGVYATNYDQRMDKTAYVLNYPSRPLVDTRLMNFIQLNKIPSGTQIHVAIMTHTGYNQEDSVLVNKGSIDRGLFMTTIYHTEKDEDKNIIRDEIIRCKPDPAKTKGIKFGNYDKLNGQGFIPENQLVENRDVIIAKIIPIKENRNDPTKTVKYEDQSKTFRTTEETYIDKNYTGRNGDGYNFAKVRVRTLRKPVLGDKFSSRHGQKGTCGNIIPECDMPFTKDGLKPDIIINPHAIPSRMTIGQLKETLLGKVLLQLGMFGDGTSFGNLDIKTISEKLQGLGYESYGNELLYNGLTGEQLETTVYIGPVFYQRLKHMVNDKQHSRSIGPMVNLTRQPAEGRSRDGGFRIGEMERDVMLAHGMSRFCRERLYDVSDKYSVYVCNKCGMIASFNDGNKSRMYASADFTVHLCNTCDNKTEFSRVELPYAYKLMSQELQCINVVPRIITE
jgi:DNA-directed RNA polymerase beta subunit